jgi:hypothetical protein
VAISDAICILSGNMGNARADMVKGDVSVFKGKKLFNSDGMQCENVDMFIFGDITGVFDSGNYCGFKSTYIFGDIVGLLEHHDYDSSLNKQLIINGNDTSTYDKLYCSRMFIRIKHNSNDKVIIQQQMNEKSIVNILMSLASVANANRVVTLNGPESTAVSNAITAFKSGNGGTLTYNGTVR